MENKGLLTASECQAQKNSGHIKETGVYNSQHLSFVYYRSIHYLYEVLQRQVTTVTLQQIRNTAQEYPDLR